MPPYPDGFAIRAAVLRPECRGHLTLASADPRTPPRIVQNFLATGRDRATLRTGLRMARDVGRQPALRPFVAAEVAPGPEDWSDAALDAHIAVTGISVHHPLGTCRMGGDPDAGAVVGGELRVHGVERLRGVDASVMPDMVGGNINAPVIMIAEKAADLIRGRAPLALVGAFVCSQAAYPHLKNSGGGKIINIASGSTLVVTPTMSAYAPSKAAMVQMARVMATAWAKDNIQVNCVVPGWINTDMTTGARKRPGFID